MSDRSWIASAGPGFLLTGGIAAAAFAIRRMPGMATFSPMILSIVLGIAIHNVIRTPLRAVAGITFVVRRVLRFAIALLGLQLTLTQVIELGFGSVIVILISLIASFFFTKWAGRILGIDQKLSELIATGTSICGAAAVVAMNTVTGGSDEDVAFAVACITLYGALATIVYPVLGGLLMLDAHHYGLWSGASIHEIAQVVAASFQRGADAGHYATIAKLSRVMMLAPMVIMAGLLARPSVRSKKQDTRQAPPVPWFIFGFVALFSVHSAIDLPPVSLDWIATLTTFLLSMALAAMGLETDVRKLMARGFRPALLGAVAWIFIAGLSLLLVIFVT